MLIIPLLLGWVIAPERQWRAIFLLIATLGLFLARYPLAMWVKTRKRSKSDHAYFRRWTIIYGSIAGMSGSWLIFVHGLWGLAGLGLVGGLLLLFHLWLISRRQEMSVIGELAGICGLALGAPMAYYTATGQFDTTAGILWLINTLYFGGTVFYIKLKVRQQPRLPAPNRLSERLVKAKAGLIYQTIALTILISLAAMQQIPYSTPIVLIPATIKMVYGAWQWQDKKSLKLPRLGVIEILHAIIFMVLVIVIF